MRILETLSWLEIQSALGAHFQGSPGLAPRGASIDTRTLEPGEIFFALKGAHADGHDHVQEAFGKGAAAVVVGAGSLSANGFALVVDDPETALFELARLIRSRSAATFVAITGSVGKTTAKEFAAELLGGKGSVLKTRGNLNNELGVPLTLARLEFEHWAAVIECGMSHAGELRRLARLIRPKVAAITNVAAVHLEFFESVDRIAEAKLEIFETLDTGDTAVAPANDPRLSGPAQNTRGTARLFGDGPQTSISASSVSMSLEGSRFDLDCLGTRVAVALPVPGAHAISNFLAAVAIGSALGIEPVVLAERARLLQASPGRGAVRRLRNDILLIDDTYNSNPKALVSAIDTLSLAQERRRVACLGDMLELGPQGPNLHREAGAMIGSRVDLLLAVGTLAKEIVLGATALPPEAKRVFENSVELASNIAGLVRSRDAVLVKGSRGVRMERVVEALVAAYPGVAA
jgi:UDP-N-acetylmuramoyl-tripeptide--D-alanyl-D-alanine ligase